jgi:SAM-dependent methyltransferase
MKTSNIQPSRTQLLITDDTMPELPPFILSNADVDWEVLFQIYEFEQYRDYANELTQSEVGFLEQALGVPEGASVLDIACGAGRHALELGRRGYSVEGVEVHAPLVEYASRCAYEDATRVRFVVGDMREANYPPQFDAVLIMNSSLGFFDDATNKQVLKCCAEALISGGRLLLQCINPYQIDRYLDTFRSGWNALAGGYLLRAAHFEPRTATLHINYRFVMPTHGIDAQHPGDTIRLYGYPEIEAMLRTLNLRPVTIFGDAVLPPVMFEERSQWQVIVAERV